MESFLQQFDIDWHVAHPLYGNVKQFVTSTMILQKYIAKSTEEKSTIINYTWGPRAELEVSKHGILEFVSGVI